MQIDSSTCDIWRMWENPDRELGAPPGELMLITQDVICALDRDMSASKRYSGGGREVSLQGESDHESFKLFVLPDEDILQGDIVRAGGVEYEVRGVVNYTTHKEGILWKK